MTRRDFGIKTVYASLVMSAMLPVLERFFPMAQPLTDEPLLELVFAIFLPAVGSAVLFNIGASSGGTDIIAMILKKHTSFNIGTVLLLVDEPQGYMYYGSLVAAPLVGDIFENIFAYLGVSPQFTGEEQEVIGEPFSLADYTGMSVQQAKAKLAALGLHAETDGSGGVVTGQIPAAGSVVDGRNTVLLFTG